MQASDPTIPVPAYAAAHAVAARVHEHFLRHREAACAQGDVAAVLVPDIRDIETMVDAAFWASMRREEGYVPTISLAFLPPDRGVRPLLLERPLPLSPAGLARLGPAVERPGIHLGVWRGPDGLHAWGLTWAVPAFCFVLEVIASGLLVMKHGHGGEGKFVNVAVLEGDQVKLVDERASSLPDCPALLTSLLGFDAPASWSGAPRVLVELAASMRAHRRGGSMLVVPVDSVSWRESIVHPIPYAVSPPFTELGELARKDAGRRQSNGELGRTVEALAGLTAIDGATIINARHEVLAFGVKIGRRDGRPRVEQVVVTEPIEGSKPTIVHPSELGGTRHLSAAQFAQDQRDALALVASQDGRFTVFAWSPCEEMVYAHRVDALLL
ncbi:MAG TPA: hypothetical protein VEU07_13400 [Candidatus Acidoferrum sp.]|nr:hypothetical protein [Candidatus Acidoferrum sp.]